MTKAQEQVLTKVAEMLGEHFDHSVVLVGTHDEDKCYTTTGLWIGGISSAIGLCEMYQHKWLRHHFSGDESGG